jgi:enoyl-CoA hydratase
MMIKDCANSSYETSLAEGLSFERRSLHATFALEDPKEGMQALIEKRRPLFQNR